MSALCLNADVSLNGLTLNTIDAYGTKWLVTDIDGWWTLPEPEIPDYPRAVSDGSYETTGRYKSRVFTLTASAIPGTGVTAKDIRTQIMQACNLTRSVGWFITHEPDYSRGSRVVLSGAPLITTKQNGITTFSVGLRAPDPIKYSLNGGTVPGYYSVTTSGTTTVTNAGDYSVEPIIQWTGPSSTTATVTNSTTGRVMQIATAFPIPGGTTLTIDCLAKSVVIGTARNKRYYLKWDSDWLDLAPGDNTITLSGGSSIEVQYRHGWIA